MYFKQFYLGCLAHASYLFGSNGVCAVVDPQRDVDQYLEEANTRGLQIKYIFETHLHADFVGGHKELAAETGAEVVFSHKANATFKHKAVRDGDVIEVGDIPVKVLETPGHTLESICLLIEDKEGPDKLLTGDTLFIGDVGRPDLVGIKGVSQEEMAGMLYESLHNKILSLDDATEVYPAHGAGSLCGKNLSTERSSTVGIQRKLNASLKAESKEEFIKMLCENLPEIPQYFPHAVEANRTGAKSLKELPELEELTPEKVISLKEKGCIVVDVRPVEEYSKSHVKGSIHIALSGQFASWAGTLIPHDKEMVIISDNRDKAQEARMRLARASHETIVGYFAGNLEEFESSQIAGIAQISVSDLKSQLNEDVQVLDVRRAVEYFAGHVPEATNIPLNELEKRVSEVEKTKKTYVICRSGYRSSVATSILEQHGACDLTNVTGGTMAWIDAGFEVDRSSDAPACQTA